MRKLLLLAVFATLLSCQNKPPTCSIIEPKADTAFHYDDNINIYIDAEDPDGSIAEVLISLDGKKLVSLSSWPYEYEISANAYSHSAHLIKVTAYDNDMEEASDERSFEIGVIPLVETLPATKITAKHAYAGGKVIEGTSPYVKGIYYGTDEDPINTGVYRQSLDQYVSYEVRLTNLEPGEVYFYQAHVSNRFGTAIGGLMSFTTEPIFIPTLTTRKPYNIEYTHALSGGSITDDGKTRIIEQGVCWDAEPNPTIEKYRTVQEPSDGSFLSNLSDLKHGTTYYVRAYARNEVGTGYGQEFTFTTQTYQVPELTTRVNNITYTGAKFTGTINNYGGKDINEKGFCWSENPEPGLDDNHILGEDIGAETFIYWITELKNGTTYHVRAYAKSEMGIGYGNDTVFNTMAYMAPTLDTYLESFTQNSAICSGTITFDGGKEVIERGLCWSTSENPTISDNKIPDSEAGIGTYSMEITDLLKGQEYYVRAYAQNSIGVSYGNEISFTTLGPPIVETSLPYSTSPSKARFGGTVVSDGGGSVTGTGIFFGEYPDPASTGSDFPTEPDKEIFSYEAGGLILGNTYYVVGYSKNVYGIGYGEEYSYTHVEPDSLIYDVDGNEYGIVEIGSQWWMAENLATTHYNDGTPIPNIRDNYTWENLDHDAYCWVQNDEELYKETYGGLYNFMAVSTNKICPAGWHVPSDDEWKILEGTLGLSASEQDAINDRGTDQGGKLKVTGTEYWIIPNTGATNEYGFNAMPAGFRYNGSFFWKEGSGLWWTSTPATAGASYHRYLHANSAQIGRATVNIKSGLSLRCIKD